MGSFRSGSSLFLRQYNDSWFLTNKCSRKETVEMIAQFSSGDISDLNDANFGVGIDHFSFPFSSSLFPLASMGSCLSGITVAFLE